MVENTIDLSVHLLPFAQQKNSKSFLRIYQLLICDIFDGVLLKFFLGKMHPSINQSRLKNGALNDQHSTPHTTQSPASFIQAWLDAVSVDEPDEPWLQPHQTGKKSSQMNGSPFSSTEGVLLHIMFHFYFWPCLLTLTHGIQDILLMSPKYIFGQCHIALFIVTFFLLYMCSWTD